jgi:hydroxypyruvate reductase
LHDSAGWAACWGLTVPDKRTHVLVPQASETAIRRLTPPTVEIHPYSYAPRSRGARISQRLGTLNEAQLVTQAFRTHDTLPWEQIEFMWCGADVQLSVGEAKALFDRMPRLRQVYWQRTGLDGVPLSVLEERGVRVISTGDLTSRWVAETVIACIAADAKFLPLAARNRIPPLDRFTRGFTGLRVTVVGTGHIGRAVAEMASSIGMQVTGLTRDPMRVDANRAVFANLRHFPQDLAATARETDYLVMALPATDATRGIIDARILGELGSAGVLVNLARPSIVDEAALLAALRRGSLRAAYVSRLERSANWVPWRSALPDNLFLTFNREAHVAEKMERAAQQFAALL